MSLNIVCPHCDNISSVPSGELSANFRCIICGDTLFNGYPVQLTSSNLDIHIGRNNIPVLVYFCSPNCIPCKEMLVDFGQSAVKFEPLVRFAIINASSEKILADRFRIYSIPTLVLFRDGQEKARISQPLNPASLKDWLSSLI